MKASRRIVLIPTYNEKESIRSLLGKLLPLYSDLEFWIIDDSSPDGTGAIVEAIARNDKRVRLVSRIEKNGLGEAYKHALAMIQKMDDVEAVLTMDADGSHQPEKVGEKGALSADGIKNDWR